MVIDGGQKMQGAPFNVGEPKRSKDKLSGDPKGIRTPFSQYFNRTLTGCMRGKCNSLPTDAER